MNTSSSVILKPGKEKPLQHKHHWIFSGAIASLPEFEDGALLPVKSHDGKLLGTAYFNKKAAIIGRMVAFGEEDPLKTIEKNLHEAVLYRETLFSNNHTTAYRLINGEGDFLPGLIIDRYADVLVLQISTLGMEKLKPLIVDWLLRIVKPQAIFEKSILPSRKEEGLADRQEILFGQDPGEIEILENGHSFLVAPEEGQKTGFFLDHREMRHEIQHRSASKRILNCFAYTGGFSVYAGVGGAERVVSVDISEKAMAMAKRNVAANHLPLEKQEFVTADVFAFLRQNSLDFDVVILDPPAFAKRRKDIVPACRGYKDINRLAMQKMPKRSLLLTCSCSYYVDEALFQKVIFQAAVEAGRSARIVGRHRMAPDHPINICHPEGDYLKSLLIYLD